MDPEDLKILYKIDNGRETSSSTTVGDILKPEWADIFNMEFINNKEKLFFEVITRLNGDQTTDKVVDSFDLSANILEQQLKKNEYIADNLCTASGKI